MPPDPAEEIRGDCAPNGFAYVFERFPTFTQTFCFREVLAVRKHGVNPWVFSIRKPGGEPFQDIPAGLVESTRYVPEDLKKVLKSLSRDGQLPFRTRAVMAFWRMLKHIPDRHRTHEAAWLGAELVQGGVSHVHTHFAGVGARTAWWIRKFFGLSYSFTAHANDVFCEDIKTPVTREKLFQDAAFVVTVSDYSASWLRKQYPFAADKIHRVYNGIELEKFRPSRPDPAAPLILSVGRYITKKGFPDLIAACALLKDRPFRCLIIGQGPLEDELKAQVAKLGITDKVEVAGPRSQSEIIDLLAKTSVFALPCIDAAEEGRDNLPTVLVEAMAAGVPIVSTPIAGVPEMVVEGKTGFLVPERDPQALASAIGELLDHAEKAAAMGAAGRLLAEDRFAIEKTSGLLCELWRKYGAVS